MKFYGGARGGGGGKKNKSLNLVVIQTAMLPVIRPLFKKLLTDCNEIYWGVRDGKGTKDEILVVTWITILTVQSGIRLLLNNL